MENGPSLSPELVAKIRQVEIYTRRLLKGALISRNKASVKGSGLEFDQLRDYVPGDDIRYIDWSATSRLQRLVVREYLEERNKTVIIAVDVSQSMVFGSPAFDAKHETVAQLASVLALVTSYARDKVGLLLFSDTIECYIPPRYGMFQARAIMQQLFLHSFEKKRTSVNTALDFVTKLKLKNAVLFLMSDFLDEINVPLMTQIAHRYDLITVMCADMYEQQLPKVGFLPIVDPETQEVAMIDLRNEKKVAYINALLQQERMQQQNALQKVGAHVLSINTSRPFIDDVVMFFRRRMEY